MEQVLDLKAIKDAQQRRIEQYLKVREKFSVGGSPWDVSEIPADRDITELAGLEDESVEKDVMTGTIQNFIGNALEDRNKRLYHNAIVAVKVRGQIITAVGPTYHDTVGNEVTFTGVLVAKGSEFLHVQKGGKAVIITANRPCIKAFGFFS